MPVSIVEVAQASEDKLEKGVLMQVLRASDVIGDVPWVTKNTLRVRGTRWQELPTPGFRQFNAGYDEDTGTLEQWTDGIFPFGMDIYIERQFKGLDEMVEDAEVTQSLMALQAMAMEFNYYFIEGTPAGGGFTGLRHRIMGAAWPARCRVSLGTAGDTLKVFASAANQHTFLDGVHELIDAVGGKADCLYMNRNTRLLFSSLARRQGLLDTTKDQFDRVVESFMGAKLRDIGLRADQATEIILSTEIAGDDGTDSTSIYAVRYGTPNGDENVKGGDGLHGVQKNTLKVYDPLNGGEMEASPTYLRRIDWPVTVSPMGDNFCMARLYELTMAAA